MQVRPRLSPEVDRGRPLGIGCHLDPTVVPKVSLAVNGWYGSTKIDGITYREFHKASDMDVDLPVAPDKVSQYVWFQVQEFYNRTWRANMKTSCLERRHLHRLAVSSPRELILS